MGHIFISYSHKDKEYVHRLQDDLQKRGIDVWIDDRIDYGTEWPHVIQQHLDECDAFIVVVSENAFQSKWVQKEVARAQRINKPFFPLLLSGSPWLSIESTQYADVRDKTLPTERFYKRLADVISHQNVSSVSSFQKQFSLHQGDASNSPRQKVFDGNPAAQITQNFRVRDERLDVRSNQFARIYFRNFWWSIVLNIVLMLTVYLLRTILGYVFAVAILGLLVSTGRIVFGSFRNDGSKVISGWGWLAGTLSLVVIFIVFFMLALVDEAIAYLSILLVGIILIGLLLNGPVELSNALIRRRAKQINEHVVQWGQDICDALLNREIQTDMTKEMVLLSWGKPSRVENQEVTKTGQFEKWSYKLKGKSIHIWFVNGQVNKISELN